MIYTKCFCMASFDHILVYVQIKTPTYLSGFQLKNHLSHVHDLASGSYIEFTCISQTEGSNLDQYSKML